MDKNSSKKYDIKMSGNNDEKASEQKETRGANKSSAKDDIYLNNYPLLIPTLVGVSFEKLVM